MTGEKEVLNLNGGNNHSSDNKFEKNKNRIQLLLMISICILIASIFFIMFEMPMVAGVSVIICACLIFMVSRRMLYLILEFNNRLKDYSSSKEKKEDFIAAFSHNIREPLNNLVVISELLMDTGLTQKQKDLIETIIASTNNMVTTVNELTMETAGTLSYEYRKYIRFNLLNTIQNTIDLYNLKDKKKIDFVLDRGDISEFEFVGDPIITKQIFLDLFNTIENKNTGDNLLVTIKLNINHQSSSESKIEMSICVNQSSLLIDQNNISTSLAAMLITSNNGTYRQTFEAGESVLNIIMPFKKVESAGKKQISSQKIEELTQKGSGKKDLKDINVLLVEDNVINQKITLLTLKSLVNNIDTATNGKEALDMLGTSKYDLILMDIQMPVMSGLVASEKIRALEVSTNSHVPIIAITANAMLGDKERCISAGIDDYLSKPFQPSVLIEKIRKLLEMA